jgi:hypothetical protein
MQFRHALYQILCKILLSNPLLGLVYLIKLDISDGFYWIALNVDDIPKLGVAFPTAPGKDLLVAFPLVLPMGWRNSPPVFSTATETIADLVNLRLRHLVPPLSHHLDNLAESIASPDPGPLSVGPWIRCPGTLLSWRRQPRWHIQTCMSMILLQLPNNHPTVHWRLTTGNKCAGSYCMQSTMSSAHCRSRTALNGASLSPSRSFMPGTACGEL